VASPPKPHSPVANEAQTLGTSAIGALLAVKVGGLVVPLRRGLTLVGRGSSCAIVVPSEKASRTHARFLVAEDGVFIEDLNSTNGVFLNDVAIKQKTKVSPGDRILIGDSVLKIVQFEDLKRTQRGEALPPELTETIVADQAEDDNPTRQAQTLEVLSGLVNKVLALGRADEAVRLLRGPLERVLKDAEAGQSIDINLSAAAARHAVRLAGATNDPYWIDLVFRMHTALERLLPLPVVDDLYGSLRSVKGVSPATLRAYVERLRPMAAQLGPTDRFTLSRIEGLTQLLNA
jgi:pSer/pThr/pTyr-binding forkhead associated (FHA) protein